MASRREFLKKGGLLTTSFVFAERWFNSFHSPFLVNGSEGIQPVKATGTVTREDKPMANVRITDGLNITETDKSGSFELMTHTGQEYIYMTLPSDCKIPVNPTGTARFYQPIKADANNEMSVQFELEAAPHDQKQHSFLVLADPQTLDQEDMDEFHAQTIPDVIETVDKQNLPQPFGLTCGDILFDDLSMFPQYEKAVKKTGIPFFQVLGNHDVEVEKLTDEASDDTFKQYFGPAYYSFDRGDVHYVVLDDVFWFGQYIGYVQENQLNWLKQDLSYVKEGQTVVVFLHIPAYNHKHVRYGQDKPGNTVVVTNRQLLYTMLEPYDAYLISGHTHESEFLQNGGCEHHVAGAVCGAWWTGPICADGTPRGYAIYEADGGELTWRYKSTGKPLDHQMRIYKPGEDEEHPNHVVANVWGADDKWSVRWFEDGNLKGPMEQGTGKDPLARRLYEGEDKPEKHTWVNAWNTSHLYYARPSANASVIAVEAIDRRGHTYREELRL